MSKPSEVKQRGNEFLWVFFLGVIGILVFQVSFILATDEIVMLVDILMGLTVFLPWTLGILLVAVVAVYSDDSSPCREFISIREFIPVLVTNIGLVIIIIVIALRI